MGRVYEHMRLAKMKIRYRCTVAFHLNTVHFVYADQYARVSVAELVEIPEELNRSVAPFWMLG